MKEWPDKQIIHWLLIDWLVGWLVGWLIDWLIDLLIHWLIDWLIERNMNEQLKESTNERKKQIDACNEMKRITIEMEKCNNMSWNRTNWIKWINKSVKCVT